jgi:hypothetical protein
MLLLNPVFNLSLGFITLAGGSEADWPTIAEVAPPLLMVFSLYLSFYFSISFSLMTESSLKFRV